MAAPQPPLFLRQLLLAHRGTAFGDTLRAKFQGPALATQMSANLRDPNQLSAALTLVNALGGGMNNDEEAELNSKITEGLPFFIQWELVPGAPNLRPWQRRFVDEAKRQWQEEGRKRLLGVYATGTGKSAVIACASYVGSRTRSLIIVPNRLLLDSMAEALGAPYEPGVDAPDNPEQPVLRKYGLIAANAPMPKVLVLPHLGAPGDFTYVYTAGGYNPLPPRKRSMIEIILDHDIVLSTVQTLSRERVATELDGNGQPVDVPDGRLIKMNEWIVAEQKPLFDLVIFDEAHHIKARTWGSVRNQLGGGAGNARLLNAAGGQIIAPINVLYVTATPYHDAGNLDVDDVRDAGPSTVPPMTPYTLLDAHEHNVVKGVVFLNINTHPEGQPAGISWKIDVLKLVGDTLRSKMDAQPHIEHRGLIMIKDTATAQALVDEYNALTDKPLARLGVPIVVESYFNPTNPTHPSVAEMKKRLHRFQITSAPNPIHVLVQCAKLGEGYDQPNISVVGICSNVGKLSKFAQFSGRAVRKLGPSNVEQGLVNTVSDSRDNMAHIITHDKFLQLKHWRPFTRQEGFGGFNPAGEDEDDEDDEVNDNASSAEPLAKKLKPSNGSRKVDRYVLARTAERQTAVLTVESGQHNKPYMTASWDFIDHHTVA